MIQTGTVIAGRYRILREIGRGGMSVVYLADDIRLNKQWAVKESKKTDSSVKNRVITSSLITEVNMLKRLRHPALPQIVDILDDDDTVAIVMDYVEGESLSSLVKREGPQSQENVTEWAIQLCDVLSYLHNQQPRPVIYRDMKPSNVMLRPDGTVAILDLGIAREYKEYNTNDTTVLGTRGYAPPEQYVGQTDARSDIYALGMTMRHLLAGVDPSFLDTGAPLSQHGVTVSREMEAILKKCTQPAAENRYQSCQELYGDLLKLRKLLEKQRRANEKKLTRQQKQEEPKPPKEPKPPREKPVKTGGKSKVPAIIAAVLALVLVIGFTGFSLLRNKGRHDDYEALIGISSATALQDKIESYEQAIELCPQRPEAYIKILEAYEDEADIIFGQAESAQFLALYDTNRDLFDPAARETAELNYKAGRMFFNYYGGVDGAFSTKIQKAYSFFLANKENTELSPEFKEKTLSDCYYEICSFYKKYILSNVVEEPSLADYEDLISTLENAIDSVKTAGAYDKLTLYKGTFVLLFDQCDEMANVNIDKQTVLDLFDEVYQEAKALSVNKEQAKKLQEEIVSHYDSYREIIERTYDNKAKRNAGTVNNTVFLLSSETNNYTVQKLTNYTTDNTSGTNNRSNDTDCPEIVIDGVENGGAYSGEVVPSIMIYDSNYEGYTMTLYQTSLYTGTVDVTDQFLHYITFHDNGVTITFEDFPHVPECDGVYDLIVEAWDSQENCYTSALSFIVNRFGSVFVYGDYLADAVQVGYLQLINRDLTFTEYNPDQLVSDSIQIVITRDGEYMDDTLFNVSSTAEPGESGWYEYWYSISKDNFTEDGIYKITAISTDRAGNECQSQIATFCIDRTSPELSNIVGLDNTIVSNEELAIRYTVFDAIGLQSVTVYVNGIPVEEITAFDDLNNFSGSFSLAERNDVQHIRIVVQDLAGNILDTDAENFTSFYEFNSSVTISTSWFANKLLVFGLLAIGSVLLIGLVIVIKRQKEKKQKASN